MKDLLHVFMAEVLKLKRTLVLRLAIGSPLLIVVVMLGIYLERGERMEAVDPLAGFAQIILTPWAIILLPLYAALAAALLAAIEHQNEAWKHLFALPVNRVTIFSAKWIAGICLLLISSLVVVIGVCTAAEVLRLTKPAWSSEPLPIAMVFRGAARSLGASGLLFSIQMWISLRWRSFLPGLVVAVLALVVMFISVPRGAAFFTSLFPWSLPGMAIAPRNSYRLVAIGLGFVGGAVVGAAGCWSLSRPPRLLS
jgi:lantibiotic transport system permease protein